MKTTIKDNFYDKVLAVKIPAEIARINQEKLKIFSILLTIVGIVLIIVDHIVAIDLSQFAFFSLYLTHWFTLIFNIILLNVYYFTKEKRIGSILVFFLCLGMGLNGAVVAGVPDTLLGRGVIAFNISMLAISVFTLLYPLYSITVYLSSFLLYLICLMKYQTDTNILAGNLINSSVIIFLSIVYSHINLRNKKKEIEQSIIIHEQTKEIDRLLNNILPASIVSEIKTYGKAKPKHLDNVTIGFIDFVAFTKIASKVSPDYIVKKLNYFFSEFDLISKKYNLEKLKTIGDAYMFAGGLFTKGNQLEEMIQASLEIVNFIKEVKEKDEFDWKIRVGVHYGPVVAGVIGDWRFIYDVLGDTVNVAARLEAAGEENKINVSGKVFESIKDKFHFESRGFLPIKNMEPIEMFFVCGK